MDCFLNAPATTEIYTLSLHGRSSDLQVRPLGNAPGEQDTHRLPSHQHTRQGVLVAQQSGSGRQTNHHRGDGKRQGFAEDRKSTRLNSSHPSISYAVFCLKKKTKKMET